MTCSKCLQLPPGAASTGCAVCKAIADRGPPPAARGRKKAVTVGISYRNTDKELKGCINDANSMKDMLVNRFNFPESSILMLTEEATDPYMIPTKHNIMWAMHWLVQGCEAGDSLVFHYSGHGSQRKNNTGDEIDGFDELLCPLDDKEGFDELLCPLDDKEKRGMIVDDDINATLVRPLPTGVKLHAIIDACHSGTMLDLPFLWGRYKWEDHRPKSRKYKGTSGGEAISFSGCDDDQTTIDTDFHSKGRSQGTMTSAFIQAIEKGEGSTYGSMLNAMRSIIKNTVDNLLAIGVARGGLIQEPQLSSNHQFDVYNKPFSL